MNMVDLNILDERSFFQINSNLFYMIRSIAEMNYPCHYMTFDYFDKENDFVVTASNDLCEIKVILPLCYKSSFRDIEMQVYRKGERNPFITFNTTFSVGDRFDYVSGLSQVVNQWYGKKESCYYMIGYNKEIDFYYKENDVVKHSIHPHEWRVENG